MDAEDSIGLPLASTANSKDQVEFSGFAIWTDDSFDDGLSGLSPTAKTGEAPVTESSNRTER